MSEHLYLPELAARPAPRYTSYPTALEFSPAVGAADQAAALRGLEAGTSASLYVHVPYCQEICWYCGCNTGATGRPERLAAYVAALAREMRTVGALYQGRISRVHFGGGSPNALSPAQFVSVAETIRSCFLVDEDAEWAAELDPRLLSDDHAAALAEAGVTRVSLGAQTFNLGIQARINRIQPFRQVAEGVSALRRHGIERINLDLMYGLPTQELGDIVETIAKARQLEPDRVAMFGYAHLPSMLPRQRMIDASTLPDAKARFWQSALAHDLLLEAGFAAVGFDHFARPQDSLAIAAGTGRLRRNFQGFTDDQADVVIGLGASSISQFPDLLVQNEKHVGGWRMRALNDTLSGVRGCRRSADDRLRAEIIERILCHGAVDLEEVAMRRGASTAQLSGALPIIDGLAGAGVLERSEWRIRITSIGRPYARLAAAAFDQRSRAQARPTSKAV
ncbi:oxygen-independent coproporphyrinogen III oxidase [Sphingomonas sp. IC4-52]|uniref:oxygen-independent coproporphyrinogen III oxidase n=1 Tax=Sphingomonas sp. IC4-52 TaxID=2887202 RepID=UPI001D1020C8|nr:oxygen-independent coproporphyrinogen III oxidase [Sphingomonas sp. IC4-52]MCC2979509.1 oxygen-independent coproporphyrinogen III oxidase [Sphingomonas sp. IC4-52]